MFNVQFVFWNPLNWTLSTISCVVLQVYEVKSRIINCREGNISAVSLTWKYTQQWEKCHRSLKSEAFLLDTTYYPSNKTMRSERSQTQHIYDFLWQYLTPCLWNYINVRSRDKARLYRDLNNYSRYSTWEMQIYKYPYQVGIRWETRETGPVEHSWGVAGSNIKTFCLTIRLQYCISNLSFTKPRDLPDCLLPGPSLPGQAVFLTCGPFFYLPIYVLSYLAVSTLSLPCPTSIFLVSPWLVLAILTMSNFVLPISALSHLVLAIPTLICLILWAGDSQERKATLQGRRAQVVLWPRV